MGRFWLAQPHQSGKLPQMKTQPKLYEVDNLLGVVRRRLNRMCVDAGLKRDFNESRRIAEIAMAFEDAVKESGIDYTQAANEPRQ